MVTIKMVVKGARRTMKVEEEDKCIPEEYIESQDDCHLLSPCGKMCPIQGGHSTDNGSFIG